MGSSGCSHRPVQHLDAGAERQRGRLGPARWPTDCRRPSSRRAFQRASAPPRSTVKVRMFPLGAVRTKVTGSCQCRGGPARGGSQSSTPVAEQSTRTRSVDLTGPMIGKVGRGAASQGGGGGLRGSATDCGVPRGTACRSEPDLRARTNRSCASAKYRNRGRGRGEYPGGAADRRARSGVGTPTRWRRHSRSGRPAEHECRACRRATDA